jgi:hypothetical protein
MRTLTSPPWVSGRPSACNRCTVLLWPSNFCTTASPSATCPGSILFQSAQSSSILTESDLCLTGILEMLFADGRRLACCDRHERPRGRCLAGREGSRVLSRGSSGRSKPCRRHLDRAQQPQRRAAAPGCPLFLSTSSCTSGKQAGSLQKIIDG